MNAARRRQSKREEAASAWKTPATGVSTRRCPPTVQHGKQPSAPAGRARREQPCRGGLPHGAPGPQKRGGTSVRTRVTQSRATRFWCRLGGGGDSPGTRGCSQDSPPGHDVRAAWATMPPQRVTAKGPPPGRPRGPSPGRGTYHLPHSSQETHRLLSGTELKDTRRDFSPNNADAPMQRAAPSPRV